MTEASKAERAPMNIVDAGNFAMLVEYGLGPAHAKVLVDQWHAVCAELKELRDRLSAPVPCAGEKEGWQREVLEWAVDKFGEIARHPRERAMRFVEEAIELAQTQEVSAADMTAIVTRIYSRPRGDVAKEIGQVGMTFEAMAENIGLQVAPLIAAEIKRVKLIPKEEWQRRHAAKVAVGAALAASPSPPRQGVEREKIAQRVGEMRDAIDMIEGAIMGCADFVDLPKTFEGCRDEMVIAPRMTVKEMRRVCSELKECTRIINSQDYTNDAVLALLQPEGMRIRKARLNSGES